MSKLKLEYYIYFGGDQSAGMSHFSEQVAIEVESGSPGGDFTGPDSFVEFMAQSLREWFDGATVTHYSTNGLLTVDGALLRSQIQAEDEIMSQAFQESDPDAF